MEDSEENTQVDIGAERVNQLLFVEDVNDSTTGQTDYRHLPFIRLEFAKKIILSSSSVWFLTLIYKC